MALAAGTQLGSFEIVGPLGAGGMGEVYRATDTKLGREVAIKTLPAALASDRDRLARFEREAKLLAALNNAHIAAIYGLDEHEGTTYLAMELIEGETLEQKLKAGALPIDDALRIALQIAEALEAAHEKGVMHRDLKPANVMLTRDGQVKVLDFGLAKAFSGDPNQASLAHSPALSAAMTQAGLILGTAAYMSPEQASGQATDQRADIWSFGVVLYEMLTGLPLFGGESVPHILADVLRMEPDWSRLPKNLHPRLRLSLERCLKKKVRDRYHSIAEARVDIEEVLRDPEGAAFAPVAARPVWQRALPLAATFVLGALAALLGGAYLVDREPPPAAAESPPLAVSRFTITPPASTTLANAGGLDLAISPDGKRIAYLAQNAETGDIETYVRELDELDAQPIPGTAMNGSANPNPFFSPDGKSIGFWKADTGLVRVSVDGSPSFTMLDAQLPAFSGATWTDDGTMIFGSGGSLQRVSTSGGGEPQTLLPASAGRGVAAPVLLPGGRAVLFHEFETSGERIAALDLETGEVKTVVEGGALPTYLDSGYVVFVRGTTLMAVPFDAAELAATGEPVALIQGVRRSIAIAAPDYALAANGTLAYVPTSPDAAAGSAVVWVDRTGEVIGRAVSELVNNPNDPHLSPDGARLLLVTGSADIWSYDLGGRPPIPLALGGNNFVPVWSPDGKQIAFAKPTDNNSAGVFTLPADGSALTPQRLGEVIGGPKVWSDAGELILVTTSGSTDIVAIPAAATEEPRKIVASEYEEFDPALSPNGRWLAYASNRTGQAEIWVQAYPDGVPARVSNNGGYEPQWSADGDTLFYLQGNAMMAVAVETGREFAFAAPTRLFAGPYLLNAGPVFNSYAVARDGRFLMMVDASSESGAPAANIVVVQNWAEELKRRMPQQ